MHIIVLSSKSFNWVSPIILLPFRWVITVSFLPAIGPGNISYVACFISVLHIFAKETRALMQSNWGNCKGGAHLNARCKLYEQFVCLPPKTASDTSLEFRNQWNSYLTIKWRSKLKFCFSRLFSWKFRAHCPKEIKISRANKTLFRGAIVPSPLQWWFQSLWLKPPLSTLIGGMWTDSIT